MLSNLNEAGREAAKNADVEEELREALGLERNEYEEIIEYGCWLNEKHEKKKLTAFLYSAYTHMRA